jgi:hypothetical protein
MNINGLLNSMFINFIVIASIIMQFDAFEEICHKFFPEFSIIVWNRRLAVQGFLEQA